MPRLALNICFATPHQALIEFAQTASATITFASPVTPKDLEALRWYIEVYATQYTGEPDDEEAKRIEAALTTIGDALFKALFPTPAALAIFQRFQQQATDKLLTIHTNDAEILALPWELLHQPQLGFLSQQQPPVAIRRFCIKNQVPSFTVQAKPILRLLFIVSRPSDEGFLNPRLDPQAVLDALADHKITQIEVEFLRPATLAKLQARLQDKDLPTIDIIHFDGHGSYDETAQCGYLAFEKSRLRGNAIAEKTHAISATQLAELFIPHHIALVVLSACQSAAVGNEPLGSVAAGLTDKGVPSVLAMVYSVLTTTTRQLFSAFYQQLATGQGIGTALDSARQAMAQHNKRGKRRRGEGEFELSLQDWFVPALYQSGHDTALLTQPDLAGVKNLQGLKHHDLPALQTAGFFGRSWELWAIERGYVLGVERITITGFGGQGKTYCAIEAAQWLLRTDLFDAVCFVDFSRYQGLDALRYAMNALGVLLDTTLPDETAVSLLLQTRRLLWVWDNLESLAAETLDELLAVAVHWSEHCRFLFTTRQHRFTQTDYAESSPKHRYLDLGGLAEVDALAYFNQLWQTAPQPEQPFPARYELLALFSKVAFHPLSIGLLAQQLKTRTIAELGERLEALLLCEPEGGEDKSLLASLRLSLERLSPEQRELVKRLGVFQGGAFEDVLVKVIGINRGEWIIIRVYLEYASLIKVEDLACFNISSSYVRFHPFLSSMLWQDAGEAEKNYLLKSHCNEYFNLSGFLYFEFEKTLDKAKHIVFFELPNLLHALYFAIETNVFDDLIDAYMVFINNIRRFLVFFGFYAEENNLIKLLNKITSLQGSFSWYLSIISDGRKYQKIGEYNKAVYLFENIIEHLDKNLSSYNFMLCSTVSELGLCYFNLGKYKDAIDYYEQCLEKANNILKIENEESHDVKRLICSLHLRLADVFALLKKHDESKANYLIALKIANEINDTHSKAVVNAQLGTLEFNQEQYFEAIGYYEDSMCIFDELGDESSKSKSLYHLGLAYKMIKDLKKAEEIFHLSIEIDDRLNDFQSAAITWSALASIMNEQSRNQLAEGCYREAINKIGNNEKVKGEILNKFSYFLLKVNKLEDAQKYAEEALSIRKKYNQLDIWRTYTILSEIAIKKNDNFLHKYYYELSIKSYIEFPGIKQWQWLIENVIATFYNPNYREGLEEQLRQFSEQNWKFVKAVQSILNREHSDAILFGLSNNEEEAVVYTILKGIENPESLKNLFNA